MIRNLRKCFSNVTIVSGCHDFIISVYQNYSGDLFIIDSFQIFVINCPFSDICNNITQNLSIIILYLLEHRKKAAAFMDRRFHKNRKRIQFLYFFQFLDMFF